jgi:hypothetical protein
MILEHLSNAERVVVNRLVTELLSHNLLITVNDGEDNVVILSQDKTKILEAMGSTGEDILVVFNKNVTGNARLGVISLVYGNDYEVISDYTSSLEQYFTKTWAFVLSK